MITPLCSRLYLSPYDVSTYGYNGKTKVQAWRDPYSKEIGVKIRKMMKLLSWCTQESHRKEIFNASFETSLKLTVTHFFFIVYILYGRLMNKRL